MICKHLCKYLRLLMRSYCFCHFINVVWFTTCIKNHPLTGKIIAMHGLLWLIALICKNSLGGRLNNLMQQKTLAKITSGQNPIFKWLLYTIPFDYSICPWALPFKCYKLLQILVICHDFELTYLGELTDRTH